MNGREYIEKLKKVYAGRGLSEECDHLFKIAHGISEADRAMLLEEYPDFPASLMEILETVDGTYWRRYDTEDVTFYFFGSDVDDGEYPYYLFSAADIMDNKDAASNFGDRFYYFLEEPDETYGPFVDERIHMNADELRWLNFSDCMNNGGTSSLFVDYTPSEKGVRGQIVRFLHDPDRLDVIADSFDEYLDILAEKDFRFINAKTE